MSPSDRYLFTVHGVNSNNDGLALLRERCEKAIPGLEADSFFFGKHLPFKELTDSLRHFIFRTLRDRLETLNSTIIAPQNRKLFIVAHSFGTLSVVRALEMQVPNLKIEGLILLGSIVPRDYYWDGLYRSGCLQSNPLVFVRPFDRIVRKAKWIGGGSSGADGFIATGQCRPREVWKNGGHTSYDSEDFNDVIIAIRDGVLAVPEKSRVIWLGEQGITKRLHHTIISKLY